MTQTTHQHPSAETEVCVSLDAQQPLPLSGSERPPGFLYELEQRLLNAETGAVLFSSTDRAAWLEQAAAYQAQGIPLQYTSRQTGRFVPVNDTAILAGGKP